MKQLHPTYRADIDGLRAIAIIPVVLFHAFPNHLKGGFAGVDVFFVISGYLISSIIFKNCEAGQFSYADFYVRRIKRIFPALIFVLLTCMLVGWFILLPNEYRQLGKHVVSGAGFVSNLTLWRESGYFDTVAELKPLLHLWSLGVEEQYYIVWPILVALIWKRAHNFLLLVVPVLLLSFAINLWWVYQRPTAAFFLPMARFWELMIGSLLAYVTLHRQHWLESVRARVRSDWLAACGLGLLVLSFVILDKDSAFPGWWAWLPTLGAFLLIYAGSKTWVNQYVLSNKLVVYVGLISYPLYLWHWPVLVMGRLADIDKFYGGLSGLLLLAVVLAIITYHWVETPLRKNTANTIRVTTGLAMAMLLVALLGITLMLWIKPLHSSKAIEKIVSATGEWDYPGRLKQFDFNGTTLRQQGNTAAPTILFIGDSNIEQYYPRAEYKLSQAQDALNLVFTTSGGCPPIPAVYEKHHPNCLGFIEAAARYAEKAEIKTIVVGAQWSGYLTDLGGYYFEENNTQLPLTVGGEGNRLAMQSLQTMLTNFVKSGKRVYLIGNIPVARENDPRQMVKRSLNQQAFVTLDVRAMNKPRFMKTYQPIQIDLERVAQASGAKLILPTDYLCNELTCPTVTSDGDPIYKDASHLRPKYVRDEVKFLDEIFMDSVKK